MLQQVPTRAFHVMAKPSGSDCNLNCDYCFYLEKQSLYREKPVTHMDDDCNQVNHLIPTRVLVKGGEITCKILK